MTDADGHRGAVVVALLREIGLGAPGVATRLERDASATPMLAERLGAGATLLPEDPGPRIRSATQEIERWRRDGIRTVTILDDGYPDSLRTVHDRPALLFLAGDPDLTDHPSGIAVVGSRQPTAAGLARAGEFAGAFAAAGQIVISGLAAGIDAGAHRAAIAAGGRTIAVIGTGADRVHPPSHANLQRELIDRHAVLSPFWPGAEPSAEAFRRRNGVMSGLSRGTVVVEASIRSGTRVQARLALGHGRPVFLLRELCAQAWARELTRRPGVHVVDRPDDVLAILARLTGPPTDG